MNENNRKTGRKAKRGCDPGATMDKMANGALCLVGLAFLCFVFGAFLSGVAALAVAAVIILAILAVFVFSAIVSTQVLKNVPHR